MAKKQKVVIALVIVLVLLLAVTIIGMAASKTKCSVIYKGIDGRVAKICYTMNVTWNVSQEQVTCNGEGSVSTTIYKSGYSWQNVSKYCDPNYYSSRAHGAGSGYLKGPFGTSFHYAGCTAYGDQVNYWACSKQ